MQQLEETKDTKMRFFGTNPELMSKMLAAIDNSKNASFRNVLAQGKENSRFQKLKARLAALDKSDLVYSQPKFKAAAVQACKFKNQPNHSKENCANCKMASNIFIDELDDKYKDKYQELIESKDKMAQGLLADVMLLDLKLLSGNEHIWVEQFNDDPDGRLSSDLILDFNSDESLP